MFHTQDTQVDKFPRIEQDDTRYAISQFSHLIFVYINVNLCLAFPLVSLDFLLIGSFNLNLMCLILVSPHSIFLKTFLKLKLHHSLS